MAVFAALVKREWLEHRRGFVWAPAILLALMLLFGLTVGMAGGDMHFEVHIQSTTDIVGGISDGNVSSEGAGNEGTGSKSSSQAGIANTPFGLLFGVADISDRELAYRINSVFGTIITPFYWLLTAVSLFTLIACLYDERRDHSILFWKSMPVNDLSTVLSKTVFVTWVAPLVTIAAIFLAQLLLLMLASSLLAGQEVARIWAQSELWLRLPELLLGFLLHGFWVLPIYAWLLLVAAALPRTPLLWAIGGPLIVIVLESILLDSRMLLDWIGQHLTPLSLPWVSSHEVVYDLAGNFQRWAILSLPGFWTGLVVAGCLLSITVYLRGYSNEI